MEKTMQMEIIKKLTAGIGMPDVFSSLQKAVDDPRTQIMRKAAYGWDGGPEDFPVRRYHPKTRLYCALLHAADTYPFYKEKGIPYTVYCDTMEDIARRAVLYRKQNGEYGLTMDDAIWLRHHLGGKLFRLGQLQFQLFSMFPYPVLEEGGYMHFAENAKTLLPEGTPLLNIHIPAKSILTPDECDRSFIQAKEFFSRFFPEHHAKAFFCFSWLLYPDMRRLLPDTSNIVQFAERFSIIGKSSDQSEALRRIYGKRFRKNADYPCGTALQKAALHRKNCLGVACGIIML